MTNTPVYTELEATLGKLDALPNAEREVFLVSIILKIVMGSLLIGTTDKLLDLVALFARQEIDTAQYQKWLENDNA